MPDYIELHCHSCFSLLDGASFPETLVERAAELNMPALALTDHDAVYGAVRFVEAARQHGIRPILGTELTLHGGYHLMLLVKDAVGWANLCTLITLARHNAPKGEAILPEGLLPQHTQGLIALSGCRQGEIAQALLKGQTRQAATIASRYRDWFGRDNFWIELQHHLRPDDNDLVERLTGLARRLGLGYVATNNVHYEKAEGHRLQDVLVCIRQRQLLDACNDLRPNAEYDLKPGFVMMERFRDYPEAVANTLVIADQCRFELHPGLQELPHFPTPSGLNTDAYLRQLCQDGIQSRHLNGTGQVWTQLEDELAIIQRSGLSNYFLIVWDIVRFARENNILCRGRGSAANSLVAYLLGIAPVNPLDHALEFGRFLSAERQVVPDIDIDFDAARREEVIQYVYQRYGHAHAAMACTLVTFRARSAIRDVGLVLGLPPDVVDHAAMTLDTYNPRYLAESQSLQETLAGRWQSPLWQQLIDLCEQIDGFPRHLGIHNGGMVVTGSPLAERLPTEPATMTDRYVVQWDKDSLEMAGLVKIDILGLRMLSAVAEAQKLVGELTGKPLDLDSLTFDDPAIYQMLTKSDTVGIFQVESRAQTQVLPRLKPTQFSDLIVSISLIRPGPIQGDMVHPYLRRRRGTEPVTYPHPLLEPALRETLGVILFQEQVLKVARDLAGFTPGQGELLRRALGSKHAEQEIEGFYTAFIQGAMAKGVSQRVAETVFDRLRAFGGYSFPKSHAAAFAVLVYQSAWLKRYHPLAFYTGILNNQPMGFWSPAVVVNDAKRHGIAVLPVHIQHSQYTCRVEDDGIRLGFNYVHGFGETASTRITDARSLQPFSDLADLCKRTQLPQRLIENLIQAGALDEWHIPRRKLIWQLGTLSYKTDTLDLTFSDEVLDLPTLSRAEAVGMEHAMTGLSLDQHPMVYYRKRLRQQGVLSSRDLPYQQTGVPVRVAGLVVVHQAPPTAKGVRFITLEDEWGFINIVVRPTAYNQYRRVLRHAALLVIEGQIQQRDGIVNVLCERAFAMSPV
jgi:error-prone DNA polymerase